VVVHVFTCVVVVAEDPRRLAMGAVVVGRGSVLPPIAGSGVVTVFGAVVAGKVVNDSAAFFCRTVVTVESFLSLDPPPHAANPKMPVTMTAVIALALNM